MGFYMIETTVMKELKYATISVESDCKMVFVRNIHRRPVSTWLYKILIQLKRVLLSVKRWLRHLVVLGHKVLYDEPIVN